MHSRSIRQGAALLGTRAALALVAVAFPAVKWPIATPRRIEMKRIPLIPDVLATASLALTIGLAPLAASAAGLDGSANLVCAANRVVACTKAGTCVEGDASTFDLVEFMFVDFKAKVVKARTVGDVRKEESPIRVLEKSNTQLVLQGVENGHGWGMAIDQAGGRMSAAVAGETASFMIFGVCTSL